MNGLDSSKLLYLKTGFISTFTYLIMAARKNDKEEMLNCIKTLELIVERLKRQIEEA